MNDLGLELVALALHYHSALFQLDLELLGYLAASGYDLVVVDAQRPLVNSFAVDMVTTRSQSSSIDHSRVDVVVSIFDDL